MLYVSFFFVLRILFTDSILDTEYKWRGTLMPGNDADGPERCRSSFRYFILFYFSFPLFLLTT
jgi:hypothetical protein